MSLDPTLLQHLAGLDLFSSLTEAQLAQHFGRETRLKVLPRRGRMPFDDSGQHVHAICDGLGKIIRTARASSTGRSGRQIVDTLLRPGDVFGRLFLEGPSRLADFEAVSECKVLTLAKADVRAVLDTYPAVMRTFAELLEDRDRRLSRRVESLVFDDVMMRVLETVLQLTVHIPESCRFGFAVDIRVTQSDLAEMIGASRQAVNRVLKSLETDDILHRHDGVLCVLDLQRLKRLVDGEPG